MPTPNELRRRWFHVVLLAAIVFGQGWADGATGEGEQTNNAWQPTPTPTPTPWLSQLLAKPHESEWRNLVNGMGIAVGTTWPVEYLLSRTGSKGTRAGGSASGSGVAGNLQASSPTYFASLQYTIPGGLYANLTALRYILAREKQPWDPDFTYCFGFNPPEVGTLSLAYCNYGGNRLHPAVGQPHTIFPSGSWSLAYKFEAPELVSEFLVAEPGHKIACNAGYLFTFAYTDPVTRRANSYKDKVALGCNLPILGKFSLDFTAYHYLRSGSQQLWDPDYTYSIGYADWAAGGILVQYSNYAGNRFPWRQGGSANSRKGAITVQWHTVF